MTQPFTRRLFGYKPRTVRDAISEKEMALALAREEAQQAASRAADLEAVLEATREELAGVRGDLEDHQRLLREANERAARLDADFDQVRADGLEHADRARRAELEVTGLQMEVAAVRSDLRERDESISAFQSRADRADGLEREVERLGAEVTRLEGELASRPAAAPAHEVTVVEESAPSEALTRALSETEQAITGLVEEARRTSERQLAETQRRRDELRAEIERMVAWRDQMSPLADEVRGLIGEAQKRTAGIGERLREVIDPVASTIVFLNERLSELMDEAAQAPPAPPPPGDWEADQPQVIEVDETAEVQNPTAW